MATSEAAAAGGAWAECEGACGWSKPETHLELTCGGRTDGVSKLSVFELISPVCF